MWVSEQPRLSNQVFHIMPTKKQPDKKRSKLYTQVDEGYKAAMARRGIVVPKGSPWRRSQNSLFDYNNHLLDTDQP